MTATVQVYNGFSIPINTSFHSWDPWSTQFWQLTSTDITGILNNGYSFDVAGSFGGVDGGAVQSITLKDPSGKVVLTADGINSPIPTFVIPTAGILIAQDVNGTFFHLDIATFDG